MIDSNHKSGRLPSIALLLLVNLIAVSFFFSPGTADVGIWGNWMREISSYGLTGGFSHSDTDYPPLAFVILAAVVKEVFALNLPARDRSLLLLVHANSHSHRRAGVGSDTEQYGVGLS